MKESFIYSIGHGNKSIEDFISVIHKFGIKYLIDVRSVPYSKFNPAFNQASLEKAINATGDIRYLYMGNVLGGLPKDDSLKTNGKMDYSKMKAVPEFIKGISRLVHANELKIPICVMCSESEPSHCHRSKLIGESLKERGVIMQHIVKNKLKNQTGGHYVIKSQNYVMNEINPNGSIDLFGNETILTSVKTY